MDEFKCENCNKEFGRKRDLENHLNRKKPCNDPRYINNKCDICEKSFSHRQSLHFHKKSCAKKQDVNYQIAQLKKEIDEIKKIGGNKKIAQLTRSYDSPNLDIRKFHNLTGDIPGLMSDFTRKLQPNDLPIYLLEKIYFNDDMPENWSWIAGENSAIYYDGNKWKKTEPDSLLKEIMQIIYELIIKNLKQNMTIFLPTADEEFVNKYKKFTTDYKKLTEEGIMPNINYMNIIELNTKKILELHGSDIKNDLK